MRILNTSFCLSTGTICNSMFSHFFWEDIWEVHFWTAFSYLMHIPTTCVAWQSLWVHFFMQTPLHTDSIATQTSATGNPLKNTITKNPTQGTGLSCHIQRFVLAQLPHSSFFFFFFFWLCIYWQTVFGHSRDGLPGRDGVWAAIQPGRQRGGTKGKWRRRGQIRGGLDGKPQSKTMEAGQNSTWCF